ncbi:MAG TPA: hypothetical protein ENJ95_17685 [Bacteroidetes bacterium]|nr:hypothetical protein [Bacteroidota bacterium]
MDPVLSFIYEKQGNQRALLEQLHNLITSFPGVTYKLRYRIPFYYRKSWICYLNPVKGNGIELVCLRANELSNEGGLLDFRGRKQVAGVTYYSVAEIEETPLVETLQEAYILDDEVPYAAKRKQKN